MKPVLLAMVLWGALPTLAQDLGPIDAGNLAVQDSPDAADLVDHGKSAEQSEDELGFGWVLLKTLAVLGLVIAITYLVLNHGLRRMMGARGVPLVRGGDIARVVDRVPIDAKAQLYVVQAAGKYLLIGRTDSALSLIDSLDAAQVSQILERRPSTSGSTFFQKLMDRGVRPKEK